MELEIGKRIRLWRTHLAQSQSELERAAGLSHNAISRIENSLVTPRLETIEKIASVLGISVVELQFRIPKSIGKRGEAKPSKELDQLVELIRELPDDRQQVVIELMIKLLEQMKQ